MLDDHAKFVRNSFSRALQAPSMPAPSDIPARQLTLADWSAADVQQALRARPHLVQVKRPPQTKDVQQKRIIVFVHGLNSSANTWVDFLGAAFAAPELQGYDFGLFNYQTSLVSRLNPFQRLPSVEGWARVLANTIQATLLNQERYGVFVLVGHSMGGLVSKFAWRFLLESDGAAAMRLHSLFTYGTPNHGSDRATFLGSLLSPDLALLRAFSSSVHDLNTFWNTRVSPIPETPGKLTVHERAVVSVKDYWVAPDSGISSLPEEFVLRLASSHTGLIHPTDANDPRLSWFIDQLQAIQRLSECTLIEIRDAPDLHDMITEGGELRFAQRLFEALFVLDTGSADGVEKGDKFGLYYEAAPVHDAIGLVVDYIPGAMNLLGAIEVKERVTYCKLENFVYREAFDGLNRALNALDKSGDETIGPHDAERLVLALFGRRATRIPRRQSDAAEGLQSISGRVLEEERGTPACDKALLELLIASRKFLADYPVSVLSEHAAFREAWSTMELKRYEEATKLYERISEMYPFSTSVRDARDCIERIRLRIRLRDSGDAPERKLELAEYLMEEGKLWYTDEAMELAFAAFSAKPALITTTSLPLRAAVAAKFVLQQAFGLEDTSPEAASAMFAGYAHDAQARERVRIAVQAKVPPETADMLLRLTDSVSADFARNANPGTAAGETTGDAAG